MTKQPNLVSDEALKNETGKTWAQWLTLLDNAGAKDWNHTRIARWLQDEGLIKSSWWCQTVTVGYEYYHDRRVPGETKDAGFEVGVRRTLNMTPEKAWDLLTSSDGLKIWLGDVRLQFVPGETYQTLTGAVGQIRTVDEDTKLRLTWQPKDRAKPTTLQIYLLPMASGTSIGFHHEKLIDEQDREKMRLHWRGVLDELAKLAD